ncbi:hypothetical protein DPMN_075695 [Dreissena polymorpha]|uniref:Uncharacterized protein n=1 Tax=Dreissena polymorpha TaxID=45954 RepID=A0A9D3YIL9_DREPO|nr:hypothetical protein DPMN_075695 [Dreissena polymorpha]
MGENTDQNLFVSMIKTKFPREVLLHFEVQKIVDKEWTLKELLCSLRTYIVARERSEQNGFSTKDETKQGIVKRVGYENQASKPVSKRANKETPFQRSTSAETLLTGSAGKLALLKKCRYCKKKALE